MLARREMQRSKIIDVLNGIVENQRFEKAPRTRQAYGH
jgi:hypothetical protein